MRKTKKILLEVLTIITAFFCLLGAACGETESSSTSSSSQSFTGSSETQVLEEELGGESLEYALTADGTGYIVTGIGTCTDKDLEIPSSYKEKPVTEIAAKAFEDNKSLTGITIPDGILTIGQDAFTGCTGLKKATLSTTAIMHIPRENLTTVVFTSGDSMVAYLFNEHDELRNVTINDAVTAPIASDMFRQCNNLTDVTIGHGVKTIRGHAFEYCLNLTNLVIGNSVTTIERYAFANTNVVNLTIGDSLTSVEPFSFTKLENITVSENNAAYKSIDGNLYTKDGTTLLQYAVGKKATSFTLSDSVTNIAERAFYSCLNLTSIEVGENNTAYKSVDGNLYTKDGTTLVQYAIGKTATSFTIPSGVKNIGAHAFYGNKNLTSVSLPDSIETIGAYALCVETLRSITFAGTKAQWDEVEKGAWCLNFVRKVVCADGEVQFP